MTLVKFKNNSMPVVPTFFDTIFGKDFFDYNGNHLATTIPATNIKETKENYSLELAVPGMKKSDFKIEINNSVLTISTEKEMSNEETENNFTRKEFSYHSFSRSFNLPQTVNKDAIAASYTDGVLCINIPKKEEAKENSAYDIQVS